MGKGESGMLAQYIHDDGCTFYITDRKFGFYLWEIYISDLDSPIEKGFTRSIPKAAEKIYKAHRRIVDARLTEFCIDKDG